METVLCCSHSTHRGAFTIRFKFNPTIFEWPIEITFAFILISYYISCIILLMRLKSQRYPYSMSPDRWIQSNSSHLSATNIRLSTETITTAQPQSSKLQKRVTIESTISLEVDVRLERSSCQSQGSNTYGIFMEHFSRTVTLHLIANRQPHRVVLGIPWKLAQKSTGIVHSKFNKWKSRTFVDSGKWTMNRWTAKIFNNPQFKWYFFECNSLFCILLLPELQYFHEFLVSRSLRNFVRSENLKKHAEMLAASSSVL